MPPTTGGLKEATLALRLIISNLPVVACAKPGKANVGRQAFAVSRTGRSTNERFQSKRRQMGLDDGEGARNPQPCEDGEQVACLSATSCGNGR